MLSTTRFIILLAAFLILSASARSIPHGQEIMPVPPFHSTSYPYSTNNCDDACRHAFCAVVSQFLESVTCTSHKPCLSLNIQLHVQEKCLNWRPETTYSRTTISKDSTGISSPPPCDGGEEGTEAPSPLARPQKTWIHPVITSPVQEAGILEDEYEPRGLQMTARKTLCFMGVLATCFLGWCAGVLRRRERRTRLKLHNRRPAWASSISEKCEL
ncbi:hypothetical protein L873DRAFT_1005942 [Choiromyces venosus 120613-1]|uniref:Extracellular membrane protein CFEM domain-containing protein n=1 Tax=Choiromyces venosus 120613-1 TaxID=1336337 RepID=A0A3N4JYB6_9PEZI|nr:hypothetical protein L873DRAFT_1005942 [Choiromyces venosus 120613-1]